MFQADELAAGRCVWRSSLLIALGVNHLWTTRGWDVKTADDLRGILDAAEGFRADPMGRIVLSKQVHRNAVDTPGRRLAEADAHLTDDPREGVAVRTADCVPVLISSSDGRVVGAIHAGWRGLDPAMNVIGRSVAALAELTGDDAAAQGCVAAIGPCICVERYEVGEEVAQRFRGVCQEAVRDDLGDKPHLDTRAVAQAQLIASGLAADRIDTFPGCTFDDAGAFFSYRREGQGVGHLAAVISPRGDGR